MSKKLTDVEMEQKAAEVVQKKRQERVAAASKAIQAILEEYGVQLAGRPVYVPAGDGFVTTVQIQLVAAPPAAPSVPAGE